jgi:Contractile injection system tube protein
MPDLMKIAKAELCELDTTFKKKINDDKATKVQFNPESLKVVFANQIEKPTGGGDQSGPQAGQFVGAGSTKLTATLWFDVTQELGELGIKVPAVMDVRKLTERVAYFITPYLDPSSKTNQYKPPAVRFAWGTFQFDGIMEGMEETIELFSAEGRPLRASVSITITRQEITTFAINDTAALPPPGFKRKSGGAAGTTPKTEAPGGSSLQSMSADQNADWQQVAAANGIENPRILEPGQFVDFQRTTPKIATG